VIDGGFQLLERSNAYGKHSKSSREEIRFDSVRDCANHSRFW